MNVELSNIEMVSAKIQSLWSSWLNTKDKSLLINNKDLILHIIDLLDKGLIRIAEKQNDNWVINYWIKQSILMYFIIQECKIIEANLNDIKWFDKIDHKCKNWTQEDFIASGMRVVPGAFIRYGAFIDKSSIIMPSFVNIGVFVGNNSMIDSMTTIGSCAQIGNNTHISAQVCIGGVLEPIVANPTIIEDNCFIGSNCSITEGVIIKKGAIIASNVSISQSTKIIDRLTGKITYGVIPENAVVVSGSVRINDSLSMYAVIIVKYVDEQTRQKTTMNDILRFDLNNEE